MDVLTCTVRFLKKQSATGLFIYSEEEESFIEHDQIIETLPSPTLDNRNQILKIISWLNELRTQHIIQQYSEKRTTCIVERRVLRDL